MLRIDKKRLLLYRILLFAGTLSMIASILFLGVQSVLGICMLIATGAITMIGSRGIDNMFSCPECGERLLLSSGMLSRYFPKAPRHCPCCNFDLSGGNKPNQS